LDQVRVVLHAHAGLDLGQPGPAGGAEAGLQQLHAVAAGDARDVGARDGGRHGLAAVGDHLEPGPVAMRAALEVAGDHDGEARPAGVEPAHDVRVALRVTDHFEVRGPEAGDQLAALRTAGEIEHQHRVVPQPGPHAVP